MTKPKIIFFDIDGTLVPLKEGIRPRTVEALQKLRQNGIKLCIATGRAPMEVPKFEGVTFDAFLTYNGSYCFTPERDVFKNLIPKADIALLRRNAEALGRPMALATKDRLAANGSDPDLAEYFAIGGKGIAVEKVLEFYGISKADSMAFGDGNNDLEMFGAVGTGVAMGNASEKLKAAAAAHCRTVMEDGIYWYCLEQGLITT